MDHIKLPDLAEARQRTAGSRPVIRDPIRLTPQQKQLGAGCFYHVITYGCQANVRDGEVLAGIFEAMGYQPASELGQADVILLNTCAIRDNAEKRVMGELGYLQNYKRQKPSLVLGVCGCMAQEQVVVEHILKSYPTVQLIFGTHNLYELPQLLENALKDNSRQVQVYSRQGEIYEGLPSRRSLPHKAFVNIMDGCDKFCTYCIVPYTRGKQRSRRMSDVLAEVRQLYADGYQEVTLLGQNVNAYGKDLDDGSDFAALLAAVAQTGIPRVRFTTSHPWDFTDAMIQAMAGYPNIMPFVHLPLQSGNDEILRRMGRRYRRADYLALFDRIKAAVPEVAISTDIIVGFPSETEEKFRDTLSVVDYCQYDNAFSFIFSPRPGTPAAAMADDVPIAVKKQRLAELDERLGCYSKMKNQQWVGRTVKVLCDGPSKTNPAVYCGYTPQQKLVNFARKDAEVGDIIDVKITEARKNSLNGLQN